MRAKLGCLTKNIRYAKKSGVIGDIQMNAPQKTARSGNAGSTERQTYSAPKLQRLGRVSGLTQAGPNGPTFFDGAAYIS